MPKKSLPAAIKYVAPNIQKRRRKLYAVLEIPKAIRHHYPSTRNGKPTGKNLVRLVRSLETDSEAVAKRRAAAIVSVWQSEFARLKNEGDDAAFYRRRLQKVKTAAERQLVLTEIEFAAHNTRLPYISSDPAHHKEVDEQSALTADDFIKRATGEIVGLTDHLEPYLERQPVTEKTKSATRSEIKRFATSFPTVQDVSYEDVQRWIDGLGLAPKTIKTVLSTIRGYWKYLQRPDIKAIPRDFQPFDNLDIRKSQNGPKDKRRPFLARDVIKLLITSEKDRTLNDLIRMGMWTGCRLEELCSLPTTNVHLDTAIPYIEIEDAKTEAGWRQVPVHNALLQHLTRLVKDSTNGYILPGLKADKHGDRSNTIGHKFGRLKRRLGYDDRYVFHSIRKTVITILENAGVSENVVADIVGHDKPRITYGLYSGGTSLSVKAEALAKLSYRT